MQEIPNECERPFPVTLYRLFVTVFRRAEDLPCSTCG